MPQTKAYSDRRREMNKLFRSRYYTAEQLRERVINAIGKSVSAKTISDMIRYMRAEGAPIIHTRDKGYIYDPIGFNIEVIKIDPASVEKIKLAAVILKQFPGLDIHEELTYIFEQFDMKVEFEDDTDFIQLDTRPSYEGAKYMVEILEAIKGKTVISFEYQPFKYELAKRVVVHPYLLKEWNNRWFLIGLPEHLRKEKIYQFHQFGLERMKSKIKVEGKIEHFQHHNFDAKTHFQNIIGISIPKEGKVQKVVLRFSPERIKYVTSNPWHNSQQRVKAKENTFEFQLIPNNELEAIILSFGADVEVLEPKSLRGKIAQLIIAAGQRYF